jgi:DNA-directed RNA polymerase specialized sigma24 family protein
MSKTPERLASHEAHIADLARKGMLTYEAIAPIVETIIRGKVAKLGTIGAYDFEDIAQEIRAKCARIMGRFDPEKSTAYNFFGYCADNFIKDLMRKHTLRDGAICSSCVYSGDKSCKLYPEANQCDRYKSYLEQKRRKERVCLMRSNPNFSWETFNKGVWARDTEEYYLSSIRIIRTHLPSIMRYYFDLLLAASGIPHAMYEELYEEVEYVIREFID